MLVAVAGNPGTGKPVPANEDDPDIVDIAGDDIGMQSNGAYHIDLTV